MGDGVTGYEVGDRVAGEAHKGCGACLKCLMANYTLCMNYGKQETEHRRYGFTTPGANCEYNAYSVKSIRKLPESFNFHIAALLDSVSCALHGIELIGITPGGTVSVFGPGPIGLCAMQMVTFLRKPLYMNAGSVLYWDCGLAEEVRLQEVSLMGKSPATYADMRSTVFDYEWKEVGKERGGL